jgi:hypothetical protein
MPVLATTWRPESSHGIPVAFRNCDQAADVKRTMDKMIRPRGWHLAWHDGGCMAKVIEFYVPDSFSKKTDCAPRSQRGKLIELPSPKGIKTNSDSVQWQAYMAPFAVNFANDRAGDNV